MRLLLDEMLSAVIAQRLRDLGHDAQAINGSELEGVSDAQVMDLAREQHRAVVTNNVRDFRPLHTAAIAPGEAGHWGVVFMPKAYRRTKADTGAIVRALQAKLAEFPADDSLVNGESWL